MTTIWILGDQLSAAHAALQTAAPGIARVLLVESKARGAVEKYHQIKLVLVYSALRHYAEALRGAGWEVDYYRLEDGLTFEQAARRHLEKFQPDRLVLAEPNSFFEQETIARLARKLKIALEFLPTTQFLLSRADFRAWAGDSKRLLMDKPLPADAETFRLADASGWQAGRRGLEFRS